jgi:ribosome biogenesis GTPase
MAKKKKIRVELRKNRSKPPREKGWTRQFQAGSTESDDHVERERVIAKGELSRKRTIIAEEREDGVAAEAKAIDLLAVDLTHCRPGRVLRVHGHRHVVVQTDAGEIVHCAVRRRLRNLVVDETNVVVTGDRVWYRPDGDDHGFIDKVEPRRGVLTRQSFGGKEQILAANVDQIIVVASLAEPALKPHLIDRYLGCAERAGIRPIVCLNKADLVNPAAFQSVVGLYSQLGICTIMASTKTGRGVEELREVTRNCESVFAGQSGVGKSSLLNAMQPGLGLRVGEVSEVNQKGKHTTTAAQLMRLDWGGWVVDTPGVRQFDLTGVDKAELDGLFREFRPHVACCRFPGCSHTHESGCGVKAALDRGWIATQRYESYLELYEDRKATKPEYRD